MTTTWTESQAAAIGHVGGDLLVSAAAGSGKTAVLAERCARLVCETSAEEGGCGVEGLLVLTFTEAAANEMRGRIGEAIREKLKPPGKRRVDESRWLRRQAAMVDRASISTLHGFCARVLRQHFHEAKIDPSFEVMDEDEARLIREDVLTELLAKRHGQKPADGEASGTGAEMPFGDFLEAYAQGRESTCRDMILLVYRMLSSTADPAGYVAAARGLYMPAGCKATLGRYVRTAVMGQVRLFSLTANRAVEEVRRAVGPGPMLEGLKKAAELAAWAQEELREKGAAAISAVRAALDYKWDRLTTLKDVPDFKLLKERTWERVKEKMASLRQRALVGDEAGLLKDLAGLGEPLETLLGLVAEFTAAYTTVKRGQNRLDFADLERLTLDCLTAPGSLAAEELRARYCHILVDEFQDVNPLQAALLEAVRSKERFGGAGNLFVVGDVKQSIYGFRLAEPALFLAREAAARAETAVDDGRQRFVGLPHNFRSHPNLLLAMNSIFERLMTEEVTGINYRVGHALQAPPAGAVERAAAAAEENLLNGRPVEVHLVAMKEQDDTPESEQNEEEGDGACAPAENLSAVEEEARMVAERIVSLMQEGRRVAVKDGALRDLKYRDIAILLRSMKDKAMIFARALAARGIRVHADLSSGYFDAAEVRDALALLHVLDNPQQDIPLATVLLGPYGRFSHDDVAVFRLTYDRKAVTFPDAVLRYAADARSGAQGGRDGRRPAGLAKEAPPFDEDLAQRTDAFLEKLAAWRGRLRTRPLHEGLAEIFSEARIFPYLAGTVAGSQRIANLQSLHQRALKFAGFRKQGLHRFLRFIEKLREQDGDFGEAPVLSEASDVVRIMSVHKSKGLEFPVVIAAGLGGVLKLSEGGPVLVHRDLGIGLEVADVERNIFYHSAASASIVEANRRSGRAEELRLLYVALTRARDYLILSGHVKKAEKLEEVRAEWGGHKGPLPEDVLLRGGTFLDWVLPALACGGADEGGVEWPGEDLGAAARVRIILHGKTGATAVGETETKPAEDDMVRRLLAAEPLPEGSPEDGAVARLVERVMGKYSHESFSHLPAVTTVSRLKMIEDEDACGEEMPAARAPVPRVHGSSSARAEEARRRGTATHRVLELLALTECRSAETIAAAVTKLVEEKSISAEEAAIADVAGITWFFTQSAAGKRLLAAAEAGKAEIRREIPFAWAAPSGASSLDQASDDPADWPTIRGVIDVLVVDRQTKTAEILDYKTDSDFSWEASAADYQRQMRYYLQAASEILGFAVERATLVFLTPRKTIEVTAK